MNNLANKNSIGLRIIAENLMFGGIKNHQELLEMIKCHWEFRKGKTVEDVTEAIQKGLKMGHGKTEREIECIAMYLESVFKKVRVVKGATKDDL